MSETESDPSPEPLPTREKDSFKIAEPFFDMYAEASDVFVIGGLGSRALAHPDMRISERERVISVPDLNLPVMRPDGTRRDIDILVTSTDDRRTLQIEWDIARTVRNDLSVSVCNIANGEKIINDLGRPFELHTLPSGFTSNRYTDPFCDDKDATVRYLFPFMTPLSPEHYVPWRVEIENEGITIPVPPPASTLSNYLVRSVIGLRPADRVKVGMAANAVFGQSPVQREWLIDGPGASQMEFARVLRSLHKQGVKEAELLPGVKRTLYTHDELAHHPMFAAEQLSYSERRLVLAGAFVKSAATLLFETRPDLKAWFRHHLEEHAVRIVDRRHSHR